MNTYKLYFQNQSIDTTKTYTSVRETKQFIFLKENIESPNYIFKVNKITLLVVGEHIKLKYKLDPVYAIHLEKI